MPMSDAEVDASARDYYDAPIGTDAEPLARERERIVFAALDAALDCHHRLTDAAHSMGERGRPYGALLSFDPPDESSFRAWAAARALSIVEGVSNHDNGTIRTLRIELDDPRSNYLAWMQWPLEPHACPHPECDQDADHKGRHTFRCHDGSCCEPPELDAEDVAAIHHRTEMDRTDGAHR